MDHHEVVFRDHRQDVPPGTASGVGPLRNVLDLVTEVPAILVLQIVVLAVVFRMLPNRRGTARWSGIITGATVSGVLVLFGTFGFRVYLTRFAELDAMYGAFGGPVVLILWLYVLTLAVLVGAKLAAVLEMQAGADLAPLRVRRRGVG